MADYRLRAHHGLCITFFEGKGYSNSFTEHMKRIIACLEENPEIEVVDMGDDICKKCPNLEDGRCETAEKVEAYDRKVLENCGIRAGETLKWKQFHSLVMEKIILAGKRAEICRGCQWETICKQKEDFLKGDCM